MGIEVPECQPSNGPAIVTQTACLALVVDIRNYDEETALILAGKTDTGNAAIAEKLPALVVVQPGRTLSR